MVSGKQSQYSHAAANALRPAPQQGTRRKFQGDYQAGRRPFCGRAAGSEASGGFHHRKNKLSAMQTTNFGTALILALGIVGLGSSFETVVSSPLKGPTRSPICA